MAEKFGNFRWVKEGYLDDGIPGFVVGQIEFAAIGPVDFCLKGNFKPDIAGKVIRFRNAKYVDDANAAHLLGDFPNPHLGQVSLISFDPHPLLAPHPYIEWFSDSEDHFRIELEPDEGWNVEGEEAHALHEEGLKIYHAFAGGEKPAKADSSSNDQEWF